MSLSARRPIGIAHHLKQQFRLELRFLALAIFRPVVFHLALSARRALASSDSAEAFIHWRIGDNVSSGCSGLTERRRVSL